MINPHPAASSQVRYPILTLTFSAACAGIADKQKSDSTATATIILFLFFTGTSSTLTTVQFDQSFSAFCAYGLGLVIVVVSDDDFSVAPSCHSPVLGRLVRPEAGATRREQRLYDRSVTCTTGASVRYSVPSPSDYRSQTVRTAATPPRRPVAGITGDPEDARDVALRCRSKVVRRDHRHNVVCPSFRHSHAWTGIRKTTRGAVRISADSIKYLFHLPRANLRDVRSAPRAASMSLPHRLAGSQVQSSRAVGSYDGAGS
jgi:hypothetical protein